MGVVGSGFVENDNQQIAALKTWALDQRVNVGLQPPVRSSQRAIMGIVAQVRRDEGVVRKAVARQVLRKLGERY